MTECAFKVFLLLQSDPKTWRLAYKNIWKKLVRTLQCKKKKFFAHENLKNQPSEVAYSSFIDFFPIFRKICLSVF